MRPLLDIALEDREEQSINDQLKTASENKVTLATVLAEVAASELSRASRHALGEASGKGWFKNISAMERVARDVIAPRATALDEDFRISINTIRKWCLSGK